MLSVRYLEAQRQNYVENSACVCVCVCVGVRLCVCMVVTHCNSLQPAQVAVLKKADWKSCCVVQCVAECCRVLKCTVMCCSVLQCVAACCSVLQCVAVCCRLKYISLSHKS